MIDVLSDLCFIDERDEEWARAREDLSARGQSNSQGVAGSFRQWVSESHSLAHPTEFVGEVASVYARVAHGLGYLPVDSPLSAKDFRRLRTGLRGLCRDRDWRRGEILDRFGPPSLEIWHVLAYVPDDPAGGWVCFDFDGSPCCDPGDFLLRNARLPASLFRRELAFTPHGDRLRQNYAEPA